MQVVGVVIAGGKSTRMGQDKALLEIAGLTQLERCKQLLREAGCQQIYVSRNSADGIVDRLPERGPLGGLSSVLHTLELASQRLLIVPIDMPLLTADALYHLLAQPQPAYFNGSPLPCVVTYSAELMNYLTEQLANPSGDWSIRGMLQTIAAQPVEWPYSYQLQNTNTPQQWRHAIEMLGVSI